MDKEPEDVELVVFIKRAKHDKHQIASAIRRMLAWAEQDSPYISVRDFDDRSCFYYAEKK